MTKKVKKPLNAVSLRYLALALMLLDHLWATVVPGNDWMTHLGRLAFPIFAFQAAEGYYHTSNFKQYCKRLLAFALISELPFNLMVGGRWLYPFHQNVMFTLLLGLIWLYNGEPGPRTRGVRRFSYWFYPVHLLALGLAVRFF